MTELMKASRRKPLESQLLSKLAEEQMTGTGVVGLSQINGVHVMRS